MQIYSYAVLQDKREIPLDKAMHLFLVEAKTQGKPAEMIEIVHSDTKKILFHGELRSVKEFLYVDLEKEAKKKSDASTLYNFEKKFLADNTKKIAWTQKQLSEMEEDEIEYFQDMANDQMESAMRKWMVWPKHLKERAMCLIRKHYNCPFA